MSDRAIASIRIAHGDARIGYLFRDRAMAAWDSGWRLFEGDEDGAFLANPDNSVVVDLAEMTARFPEIAPLLDAAMGTAYELTDDTTFTEVTGLP